MVGIVGKEAPVIEIVHAVRSLLDKSGLPMEPYGVRWSKLFFATKKCRKTQSSMVATLSLVTCRAPPWAPNLGSIGISVCLRRCTVM